MCVCYMVRCAVRLFLGLNCAIGEKRLRNTGLEDRCLQNSKANDFKIYCSQKSFVLNTICIETIKLAVYKKILAYKSKSFNNYSL